MKTHTSISLVFALLMSTCVTALGAATPNWNGCHVNDYKKEFARKDMMPFGKPHIDWTTADFDELRRRALACIDPYFAVPGRQEFYVSGIDFNISNYKRAQQQLISQIRERELAERDAVEQANRARDHAQRAQAAMQRFRELAQQGLDQIATLRREVDQLPTGPQSASRLDEVANVVQKIGAVNSMDDFVRSLDQPSEQSSLDAARQGLLDRVREKRQASVQAGLEYERKLFRARAASLATSLRSQIANLGIPTGYLEAPVIIKVPDTGGNFITLQEVIALLIDRNVGTISAYRYKDDGALALAIKTPGEQSKVYGLKLDGGELFLSRYEERGMHEYLTNPVQRLLAEAQLRDTVGWPNEWSGKIPCLVPSSPFANADSIAQTLDCPTLK